MNLDCIAQVLINAGYATALGADIFELHMDDADSEAILLRLPMEGVPINHYIPGYFKGRFQVILRSKSIAFGNDRAFAINQALTFCQQSFFDANANILMRVLNVYPVTLPIIYPRSIGNEFEWSCNFLAHYVLPAGPFLMPPTGGSTILPASGGSIGQSELVQALLALPDSQLLPLATRLASLAGGGGSGGTITSATLISTLQSAPSDQLRSLTQSLIGSLQNDGTVPATGNAYQTPDGFIVVAQ